MPGTQLLDVRYTVTAVSGVFFQGNAGNPITGAPTSSQPTLPAQFGSGDQTLEGYFDLSGVPLPPGENSANYQLTLEPINSLDTVLSSVGPYILGQVTPSGTLPTLTLNQLQAGSSQTETITIADSAGQSFTGDDGSESSPAQLALSGEWTGRLTGYGHSGWIEWHARANREFTMEAQALDETGQPTNNKAELLLGLWNSTDTAAAAPSAFTPQALNTPTPGLTTLSAVTTADTEVRLGIADARGDGRPDYLYRGRILYADSVAPPRLPAGGGPIVIKGTGFRANSVVTVNGSPAAVTSVSPNEITAMAPPSGGFTGSVQVQVQDSQTRGVTIIADGLSYSAQNGDALSILAAPSGSLAVGVPQPFTVKAMNWDDEWPAAGIPVTYAVASGTATLGCGQSTCTVTTAQNGVATLMVSPNTSALTRITASLTSGASIAAEFSGVTPAAISAVTPALYLAIGGTTTWTPEALVQLAGAPAAGVSVTWSSSDSNITVPAIQSLSAASGIATQQIAAGPLAAGEVAILDACLAGNANCAVFSIYAVHLETAALSAISGTSQLIAAGQNFAPVTLEVTDAIGHPMAGAAVAFYQTLHAWTPPCPTTGACPAAPILAQAESQAISAADGSVTLVPLNLDGQAGRLTIIAVVGPSATYECQLESHP
jgi:hypothetical protein